MKKALLVICLVVLVAISAFSVTKIQFWHAMGGWRIDMLNEMAAKFMKLNPDIAVEVQYTGSYDETLNKLVAGIQAGTAPHVVQNFEVGTQKMIDGEVTVVMQDLIDKDPTFDMGKFLPQVLNYYRVNGKLYCMPFNSSNPVLFYNKTMFEKAGLNPNSPPRTFTQLMEFAKKLTVKDANGNILQSGITWNLNSWFFEEYMAVQNAPFVDNDNGRTGRATKAVFNTPEGLKFFKLWNDLTQNGYMLNTKAVDWTAARQMFLAQKVGMLITSTSDVALFTDSTTNGFTTGAAFLPKPDNSPAGGVVIGGGALWIIAGHPKAETDAAWKFVKFLAEEEQQVTWHLGTGYFPVDKNSLENLINSGYYAQNPNLLTSIFQLLLSVQTYNTNGAIIGAFPEVRNLIQNAVEKMLNKELTPEKALELAEKEATKAIQSYNELF